MLVVRPQAADEIRAAASAYEDVDRALRRAFVNDVDEAIRRGSSGAAPAAHGVLPALRAIPLPHFGYRLFFYEHAGRLYLVACRRIPRALCPSATRVAS